MGTLGTGHWCDKMFYCRRCGDMWCEHDLSCACDDDDDSEVNAQ